MDDSNRDSLGGSGGSDSGSGGGALDAGGLGGSVNGGAGGDSGGGGSSGAGASDAGIAADSGPDVPENLLADGSFEGGGTLAWTCHGGACTLERSTAQARSGTSSMLVSNRLVSTWEGPAYALLGVLEPNTTYAVSGWLRSVDGGATLTWTLKSLCEGATTENYKHSPSIRALDDAWQELAGSVTTPDCAMVELLLYVEGTVGEDFYVDDASLFQMP